MEWPWPDSMDAVVAAPDSHIVLFENERVRVLEVVIQPGAREPMHTHRWPSVMILDGPARIRYYGADGELVFETSEERPRSERAGSDFVGPEGLHAVENIDGRPYHAFRVEIKAAAGLAGR